MVKDPVTTQATEQTASAVRLMLKNEIGSIIVVEKEKPVGILTERDILTRAVQDANVLENLVSEVMTRKLVTVTPETTLLSAFEIMAKNRIRRLPVLKNEKLVGILTERDLCRWAMKVAYR